MRHRNGRSEIECNGLELCVVRDDPDGMPTYNRTFLYQYDATKARAPTMPREELAARMQSHQLTDREAWNIAKFITRHLVKTQALQVYKRLRKLAGRSDRPPEPW